MPATTTPTPVVATTPVVSPPVLPVVDPSNAPSGSRPASPRPVPPVLPSMPDFDAHAEWSRNLEACKRELDRLCPVDGYPFVRERLSSSTVIGQDLLRLVYSVRCLEHNLRVEGSNRRSAENEVDLLRKSLTRSQEQTEATRKERDEALAVVAERDAQLGAMREVQLKMSDVEKELNAEIASLKARAERAEKSQSESETARKKAEFDLQVLQSERNAANEAHVRAVELVEAECLRLNGEVSSLQAALGGSRSPRQWTVNDIPRDLKIDFLT